MSKHPKDRAERLELKKKKDKAKKVHIKSFQELVEHINANFEADNQEDSLKNRPNNKGLEHEDADD